MRARGSDLTGQRFGKLRVIARVPQTGRNSRWLCRCECGNTVTVQRTSLVGGKTLSCKCMMRTSRRRALDAGPNLPVKRPRVSLARFNPWTVLIGSPTLRRDLGTTSVLHLIPDDDDEAMTPC